MLFLSKDELPVRSLHIISTPARRGAETFAIDLCQALREFGDDAEVVALSPASTDECHDVPTLGRSRRAPETLTKLRALATRADVTVAHGSSTLEACAVGMAWSSAPFVYRSIGDPNYWVTGPLRTPIIGSFHRRASHHVALWSGAAERLSERYDIDPARISIVPNATDAARWLLASPTERSAARASLGLGPDGNCLAFVGALSPEKDVDLVLDTAIQLPDVDVLIAGDGPERTRLERRASMLGASRVRFLGPVRDPRPIYAAADLLLLPSLSEGMPAVIIEAGLVGTPSLATAVGAVPEMIIDGETGYLVLPEDRRAFPERARTSLPTSEGVGRSAASAFHQRYSIHQVAPLWREVFGRLKDSSARR